MMVVAETAVVASVSIYAPNTQHHHDRQPSVLFDTCCLALCTLGILVCLCFVLSYDTEEEEDVMVVEIVVVNVVTRRRHSCRRRRRSSSSSSGGGGGGGGGGSCGGDGGSGGGSCFCPCGGCGS